MAEMDGSKMPVTEQGGLPLDGLRQSLDVVDPVALLLTSTHLTGNRGLLREEWRPDLSVGVVAGGYSSKTRDDIGRTCVAALERVGDGWERARPSYDLLERAVEWAMGAALPRRPAGIIARDGPAFHTAHWNHSIDLTGKRVGVIGTGASGMQMIPAIAEQAAEVRVFARTATFLLPTPHLRHDLGEAEKWLLAELPHYRAWYRAVAFLPGIEGMLSAVTVDPTYPPTERAVSATSEQMRAALQGWIDAQTEDDLHLRDALTPRAPFGAKRWVADDGTWITTLKRPDVHLVRDPIKEITESGVRCADDQLHELDVLIYATGFHASEFLAPMQVTGRGAVDLQQHWAGDDARAYLGSCVPGFPNFFCLYGPNTNVVVHGASLFFISECAVRYVVDAVRTMLETGSSVIEVRESVARAYDERLDEVSNQRAWAFSSVRSFYKNSTGRSTLLWPFTAMELWQRTHRIDPADFLLHT
ncbi:flavin-containing monooxygenase [Pseudonocardia xinjiangensis]|uniref:flavin-containing monooxygenase n=1 Tax=Pseudonocardia xinjiangensis TaxID=75289 RepID=UPI003D8CE0DE